VHAASTARTGNRRAGAEHDPVRRLAGGPHRPRRGAALRGM